MMQGSPDKAGIYIVRARDAELIPRQQSDSESKITWLRVAASWRLLAERALMERTGGELLLH